MTITLIRKKNNKRTTNRGAIFSLDALISFVIMLLFIVIFVTQLSQSYLRKENEIKDYFLEEKTLLLADTLVKNYNSQNTTLGSAIIDIEKKRVKSNEISITNLKSTKGFQTGPFFVKKIIWKKINKTQEEIILDNSNITNCLSAKRFVLIDGEKGLIELVGCVNEEEF